MATLKYQCRQKLEKISKQKIAFGTQLSFRLLLIDDWIGLKWVLIIGSSQKLILHYLYQIKMISYLNKEFVTFLCYKLYVHPIVEQES